MRSALKLLSLATLMIATPVMAKENLTKTFTGIEQKWLEAIVKKDAKTLSAIVAPDWHGQNMSGKRSDRATSFAGLKDKDDVLSKFTLNDVHVVALSPTIAIVQGSDTEVASYHGKDTSGTYSWTDVFQKRGGKWVAVASQVTKVDPPR